MSPTPAASSPAHVLPPGPSSPAWWQLVRFAGDPLRLLDECHRRYGDAFTLNIAGNGRFVMLSDPEAVREVFRGDPDVLHSGEANALFIATVGRHSVLVLDEAPHARQRRVLVPPLKGERMRAFFDAMRLETLEAVRAWPRRRAVPRPADDAADHGAGHPPHGAGHGPWPGDGPLRAQDREVPVPTAGSDTPWCS